MNPSRSTIPDMVASDECSIHIGNCVSVAIRGGATSMTRDDICNILPFVLLRIALYLVNMRDFVRFLCDTDILGTLQGDEILNALRYAVRVHVNRGKHVHKRVVLCDFLFNKSRYRFVCALQLCRKLPVRLGQYVPKAQILGFVWAIQPKKLTL